MAERCKRDVNYFDGRHMATNTSSQQQKADFVEHDEEEVLESNGQDTGENGAQNAECDIPYYDELETILEEDEDSQMAAKQDINNLDMIAYNPEESEEEPFNPFDTFGSAALPIGTYLNYHWERCAPINTTLTYKHLVIQNGFVARHMK